MTLRTICLTLLLLLSFHSQSHARHGNKVLEKLGSAEGIAIVGGAFNTLNGFASFFWAYDLTRNNVTTAEIKSQVQEGAGIASAALTWTVGAIVPVYAALYVEHMRRNRADYEARHAGKHALLLALVSPVGLAIVSFIYQVLRGAATFVWAYDWTRNGVATAEQKVRIQEAGGLTSAGLALSLGGLVPLYCYLYSRAMAPPAGSAILPVPPNADPVLDFLASPKGIAGVAFVSALIDFVTTFVWSYDWTRDGVSPEQSARIQEGGGIASAAFCWVIAGFVPFYLYLYTSQMDRERAQAIQQQGDAALRAIMLTGM